MVVVEVTTWCNLRCPGCNRTIQENRGTWQNKHMSLEDFRLIVTNLPYADQIVLHGIGEPTMNPSYLDIIRAARHSGKFKNIVCITNALARDVQFYEEMISAGMSSFTVSVDSLTQTIADKTRTGTQVDKLIERLAAFKERDLPFSVTMVASRINQDDLTRTLSKLDELGVDTVHVQPYIEFDEYEYALNTDEITRTVHFIREAQRGLRRTRVNMPLLTAMVEPTQHSHCPSPWLEPGITVDGFLTPCCVKMDASVLGFLDMKAMSFAQAQESTAFRRFLSSYYDSAPDFCKGCFNNHRSTEIKPLITVTLVSYNQKLFVRDAVNSVLVQTYSPLEIIISDDASTDGTADIIESCLAAYTGPHRVRFLRQPTNLGARGRNNFLAAYRMASGRYIVWFCGDDMMQPTMVERMAEVWINEKKTLVTVNAELIDSDSHLLGRCFRDPNAVPSTSVDDLACNGANDCNFGAGMGFSREMVDVFGFDEATPPPHFPPDTIFPFYAGLLGGCTFITEPLMKYRIHGGQTSLSHALNPSDDTVQRLQIEKKLWLGHIDIARYMDATLDKVVVNDPERFGSVSERLRPLIMHQTILMSTRLLDIATRLHELGHQNLTAVQVSTERLSGNTLPITVAHDFAIKVDSSDPRFWNQVIALVRAGGELELAHNLWRFAVSLDSTNHAFIAELETIRDAFVALPSSTLEWSKNPARPQVAVRDIPVGSDIDALTFVQDVSVYFIDVSDECNLRCTYCHQSVAGYKGHPMSSKTLSDLRQMVRDHPPLTMAYLSSSGETTTLPGWTEIINEFVTMSVPCGIISNFARVFTAEEIATLSHLTEITISIDSIDPYITKNVRHNSDIKTVLYNFAQIKTLCVRTNQKPPRLIWNVVSYDLSLIHAASLAAAAVVYRPDHVTFCQLKLIPGVTPVGIRTIIDLPDAERADCARELRSAIAILEANDISVSVNEELKIDLGLAQPNHATGLGDERNENFTRDCLMPWEMFLTHSNGSVKPCCNAEGITIGQVRSGQDPFSAVFNGPEMRSWRRAMLTGELPQACKVCTSYPITTREKLIQRVTNQINL